MPTTWQSLWQSGRCHSTDQVVTGRTADPIRPAAMRQVITRQTGGVSLLIRRLQVRVLPGAPRSPGQSPKLIGSSRPGTSRPGGLLLTPNGSNQTAGIMTECRMQGTDASHPGRRLRPLSLFRQSGQIGLAFALFQIYPDCRHCRTTSRANEHAGQGMHDAARRLVEGRPEPPRKEAGPARAGPSTLSLAVGARRGHDGHPTGHLSNICGDSSCCIPYRANECSRVRRWGKLRPVVARRGDMCPGMGRQGLGGRWSSTRYRLLRRYHRVRPPM
jgi:hypothetical protein